MTLGKSLEDYLETILILKIKKGMVRSIDVADYMGFSKPRVSHAVKQLKTQGFLLMDLLLEYAGEARDIADPWYTGNFDVTYEDVKEGCEAFLQYLIENEPLY